MGIFSILKIESLFPFLSIYFFPHFCPSPNQNFGVPWGKMGLDPPYIILKQNVKEYIGVFVSLMLYQQLKMVLQRRNCLTP